MADNKNLMDSLSNFATALENLVDELKTQNEAKQSTSGVYQGIFGNKGITIRLKRIEEGIKKIKKDTTEILKNQTELLKLNKARKREEETGLFDKSADKGNLDKIKNGVGTIILIAGAVLAIGMAFKIIGPVDVISIIALSFSITLLGITLAKLQESGIPKPMDALLIGLSLLSFTGAVVMSSYLLSLIPEVSITQLLTFSAIAAMFSFMGDSIKALVKATKDIKVSQLIAIPIILTSISLAIVASSYILGYVQPVPGEQLLNILMIGATLGVLALVMSLPLYVIGKMGGDALEGALLSLIILPAISTGIFLSSLILGMTSMINTDMLLNIIMIGMTLAVLSVVMTIPLFIFGKMGDTLLEGALYSVIILPLISLGVMISSHILALGNYTNPIPLGWAIGFSLSMLILAIPVAILGILGVSIVAQGALGLVLVAAALVAASWLLSLINPDFFNKIADSIAYFIDVVGGAIFRFAQKTLPLLVNIAGELLRQVLPPLQKFISGVLPSLGEFFGTIIDHVLPAVDMIITAIKEVMLNIDDIILAISKMIDSIGGVIESVGKGLESVGNAIATPIKAIGGVIETIGNTIVRVITGVTDSAERLSKLDANNMIKVGQGLGSIAGGLSALGGGGILSAIGNFFNGGIDNKLEKISKHYNEIYKTGVGMNSLAAGFKTLSSIDIDDNQVNKIVKVLDRINKLNASANINATTKQVIEGGNLINEIKSIARQDNEDVLDQLIIMNQQLAIISSNSSNISSQLNQLREEDVKLDF